MAFTVQPTTDATLLAQTIVGTGVTLLGTPVLTGVSGQAGTFSAFTTGPYTNPITGRSGTASIPSGVILSSGLVANAVLTYSGEQGGSGSSDHLNGDGDPDLTEVSGFETHDAVTLSFDFIPDRTPLYIQYVFVSTEYPHFVNTVYNDVFIFMVNGVNVAVTAQGHPVTVNRINVGKDQDYAPDAATASNPNLFTQYSVRGETPFNYGGATVLLTARATVMPNVVNTFKFAIGDASDYILDAAVMIGTGYFSTVLDRSRYYAS